MTICSNRRSVCFIDDGADGGTNIVTISVRKNGFFCCPWLTGRDVVNRFVGFAVGLGLLSALLPTLPVQAADLADQSSVAQAPSAKLLFTSAGRLAAINADGTGLRWLEFDVPDQVTWQAAGVFPDGHLLLLSMEQRRDGPGRPFEQYYTQTPTHIWRYDLETGQLEELATQDRMAPFYTPALLLGDDQMLVQVVRQGVGQIFRMRLDGSEAQEFTRAGEGMPYGLSLSPDEQRVAFHLASPQGYQVWTSDRLGQQRIRIAADPAHLFFGTRWSPDGQWIAYHDCHYQTDPGHDWSDLCIGRADGSQHRVLTQGQIQWFGVTYGPADARGGGSDLPSWTPDGKLIFSRRLPGAKVPWEYQADRPDVDHFNRDFKPQAACGGTEICWCDPDTGSMKSLTSSDPAVWDFRATISPDGSQIAFCRAATGEVPALWVMDVDGARLRRIATGRDGQGIDHPRWIPGR